MKYLIIILLSISSTSVFGQVDINIYLETACENNAELKAKRDQYLAAMEQIPQVRSLDDPQISLGIFLQSVETRLGPQRASLALSQSFPWFGTLKAKGNAAALKAEAILGEYEEIRVELYREIRLEVNNAYLLDRSIEITNESIQILQSFKELARINFENGNSGFVNLLRIEMEEQELKVKVENLEGQMSISISKLEQMLNAPLPQALEFKDSQSIVSLPIIVGLLDSIQSNNTRIYTLSKHLDSKNSELSVVDLTAKPSFTLGASYINIGKRNDVSIASNGKDAFLLPQLGMRLPIFRKKYDAMKSQIKWEAEAINHQIENEKGSLTAHLEKYEEKLKEAKRNFSLYTELTDLSERARTLLETEFSTSGGDFEELISMERKLLAYKLELEKARVEQNKAIYHITYLLGR